MFQDKLERIRLSFEVVTPLFVGNGQEYNSFECVQLGKKIFVLDNRKLFDALKEKNLVKDYSNYNVNNGISYTLNSMNLLKEDFIESVSKYSIKTKVNTNEKIKSYIRDGFGKPYIPGSSIKGYIRTAVLYNYLKSRSDKLEKIEKQVQSAVKEGRRKDRIDENFDYIFNHFIIKNDQVERDYGPNTDIMRCIQISDAYFKGNDITSMFQVKTYRLSQNRLTEKQMNSFCEAVDEEIEGSFSITLDNEKLNVFKSMNPKETILFNSLSEIKKMINTFTDDMIDQEMKFFNNYSSSTESWYKNNTGSLSMRLGMHTGMLYKTIISLLGEETKKIITDIIFKKNYYLEFPKSRKFSDDVPPGWIVLTNETKN